MSAPFSAGGTTTGSVLIWEVYGGPLTETVYRNGEFLPLFGTPVDSGGGTKRQWPIHYGGNSSVEVFTESTQSPLPDSQDYTTAYVSYKHFRAMVQITGIARDAMRSNIANGIDLEMMLVAKDLLDLVNTTWMDSTSGLLAAVDSTTAYGGKTRGSISYFEALETAVNGIVGFDDLINFLETLRDADIAASTNLLLLPWSQYTRLYGITGQPAIKNTTPVDAAQGYFQQTFAGLQVQPLRDLTSTVILGLDTSPGNFEVIEHRPLTVHDQGRSGDSDVFQISTSLNWVCYNPMKQGKLTGCTA